jgi:hypothetical protein
MRKLVGALGIELSGNFKPAAYQKELESIGANFLKLLAYAFPRHRCHFEASLGLGHILLQSASIDQASPNPLSHLDTE